MKRITLAMMFVAAAAAAHAQDPVPSRPRAPRPAPAPAPAPLPAIAPRAPRALGAQWLSDEELRDMRDASLEAARAGMDASRSAIEAARDAAREATRSLSYAGAFPAIAPMTAFPAMPNFNFDFGFAPGSARDARFPAPPAPWAQGDPADSIYRVARNALNSGEYGRAARMFAEIQQKYPKSAYQVDSPYYEAYARYKIGTTDELNKAARILEPIATRSTASSNGTLYESARRSTSDTDVATLYNRINGVLAQRGDRSAADKIIKVAGQAGTAGCDNEDVQVRVEALNALSQMDPAAALPLLRRVLDRKDDCSRELRQRAVFMLGRRADNESAQLLINAAKNDPSQSVRIEAINTLPRLTGDIGLNALEELLRAEQDERIQRSIVRALTSSDNVKARSSMRALIDRKDAPLNLRVEAVSSFNNERATSDDANYLRNLYGKTDELRLKEAIIGAVGRMGGAENDKWVLSIAQNQNESGQLRAAAISRMMRSNTSIGDLSRLYESAAESYNIRSQIIGSLANRREPEATDKLFDIVKNSTVVSLRTQAINALSRKNDPRTAQLLMDLVDGAKKP
jgi:HEAT repeat protein